MIPAATDLPLWAGIPVALLVFVGSLMTLIGSLGLTRLQSFYDRVHAPTMGSSAGVACISIASILCFSVLQSRLAMHEALIFLLFSVTTPVTLMLLIRAGLFRDRVEGNSPLPPSVEAALRRHVQTPSEAGEEEDAPPS